MTGAGGQEPDSSTSSKVLEVLQRAIADYGVAVLSNPVILEGVCEDRLPENPREASLISAAARFDVVSILNQQVPGVGVDAAVNLTANSLAESRSLDPSACQWVVSEFAQALGHEVSPELVSPPPLQGGAPHTPAPATVNAARLEAPTIAPEQPAPAGVYPPPVPPLPGAQPPGVVPPGPSAPQPPRRYRRTKIALSIVVGIFGVLVVIGGIGDLVGSSSPSSTLASYIPSTVSRVAPGTTGSNCTKAKATSTVSAEYDCITSSSNLPVGFVIYFLYPSSSALNTAYRNLLTHNHVSRDAGNDCGNFDSFTAPCETGWSDKRTNEGRVMEFTEDSTPAMIFTVTSKDLLVGMEGNNGNNMFQWWSNNHWATPSTVG